MTPTPRVGQPRVSAEVRVRRPVDASAAEEMRKSLSHLYEAVTVEAGDRRVRVEVEGTETEESLARVVEHFLAGHREVPAVVIHDRRRSAAAPAAPSAPRTAQGLDGRIPTGPGTFLQGPHWLAALDAVRSFVDERLADRFDTRAWQTPALIDERVLVSAGYFAKFPHMVSTVHRMRADYWDMVAVGELDPTETQVRQSKDLPSGSALTPVTCYHVYAHAGDLIERRGAAGLFQINGPVFRHEGGNHGLTRLAEFTMTEMVGLGTAADIELHHRALLDTFLALLDELGVDFYVSTASDPFFGADANMLRAAQLLGAAKYEVRIPVPGGSDLSVASVNRHGETFVRAFNLDRLGVEETCCAGIGLERLTYALLAHDRLPRPRSVPTRD